MQAQSDRGQGGPEPGDRHIARGIIGLADKHDPPGLKVACARAIAAGDPSYRTIKEILAAGTERDQFPAPISQGRRRDRVVGGVHPHDDHPGGAGLGRDQEPMAVPRQGGDTDARRPAPR